MNINLEYYKVFYTVVKTGSISGAAAQLFISQPAVSQAVKHLETTLGASLFFRTSKGVRLTPEGEALYTYVSQGYEYFLMAEDMFQDILNLQAGEIRIGASDMTLRFYLLPFLEQFHRQYPKVKISVTNGPTPETMKCLKNGTIDFGVVTAPVYSDKWMDVQEMSSVQDCFVASDRFAQLKGRILSLEEMVSQPLIMLEKNTSTRRYADSWLAGHGVTAYPEFELATSELIVQFALRSMGIGYVVKNFAQEKLESGELFEIQLATPIPRRSVCLITPARTPVPPAGKRLLEMLCPTPPQI